MDLAVILYKLRNGENCGYGKCIIDTNGELSCGSYCFQEKTFKKFCEGEWNHNEKTDTKCAIKMIMIGMGHETGGWYNTWKRLNLPII